MEFGDLDCGKRKSKSGACMEGSDVMGKSFGAKSEEASDRMP